MNFKLGKMFAVGVSTLVLSTVTTAQIDEIIVTANKKEQTLQDIPMSVTVTSAEQIEQSAIVDLLDLQSAVPSLRMTQLQKTTETNFIIRGFGNGANNPGIEPAVGVYIDGVYRSRSASAMADLPTIERVEVLAGPQSTLFGKNASAGVISITSKLPEQEFGGLVETTIGTYGSTIVKGTVTGGITDTTSFRLSASSNKNDGYSTNLVDNTKYNDRDRSAIRGQLLIEPSEDLSIRMIADYNQIEEVCCIASSLVDGATSQITAALAAANGYGYAPIDPWGRIAYQNYGTNGESRPANELVGKGISVQVDWSLDNVDITSITSKRNQTSITNLDADFSAADIISDQRQDYEFDTFSQEIRISSNDINSNLDWMVGAYYQQEDIDSFRNVTYGTQTYTYSDTLVTLGLSQAIAAAAIEGYLAAGLPPAGAQAFAEQAVADALGPVGGSGLAYVGAAFGVCVVNGVACTDVFYIPGTGMPSSVWNMDNTAMSFFGQMEYRINDSLTATLGLAYSDDSKDVSGDITIIDAFAALPLEAAGLGALSGLQFFPAFRNYPNADEDGKFDSDDVTHTLSLAYAMSDNTSIYATHSSGFKATSVNMTVDARDVRAADPEDATNYEIGLKTTFDNGYINLAYFDQNIEGFQSNAFSGTGFNLVNAGKESHKGVELDSMLALSENLMLRVSAMQLDAVYDSFEKGTCDTTGLAEPEYQCPAGQPYVDLSGLNPAGIHDLSANANIVYSFNLGGALDGFARLEYVYEEDTNLADLIPVSIAERGFKNVNASLGFNADNWSIMFWGRNITDHETLYSAFPTTAAPGSFSGYPSAPSTYGVTFKMNL